MHVSLLAPQGQLAQALGKPFFSAQPWTLEGRFQQAASALYLRKGAGCFA